MTALFLQSKKVIPAALLAMATTCLAEAPSGNAPAVKVTPEIIRHASLVSQPPRDAQPPKDAPLVLRQEPEAYDMFRDQPKNLEHLPNGCAGNSSSLCFDYRAGQAVYKPMRKLLPDLPGMTPHNLSVRRNKIVAEYRF